MANTGDSQVRGHVIARIERCPSGLYVYALEAGGPGVKPELPQQIAVVTETTLEGPITGPLWVTGYVAIEPG